MTITLDLPQELERALSSQAKQFGVSLQDYLLHVLYTALSIGNLPIRSQAELLPHEKAKRWEEWAASHSLNQTVILDDSREVIYGNEER